MSQGNRQRRLSELLKQEISKMIMREIKDPRIGFASITSVDVAADLKHAKVFVSVFGTDSERRASLAGLRSAAGFVRRELGVRLRLKYIPELKFVYDDSIEYGTRMVTLIDSVVGKEDHTPDDE